MYDKRFNFASEEDKSYKKEIERLKVREARRAGRMKAKKVLNEIYGYDVVKVTKNDMPIEERRVYDLKEKRTKKNKKRIKKLGKYLKSTPAKTIGFKGFSTGKLFR